MLIVDNTLCCIIGYNKVRSVYLGYIMWGVGVKQFESGNLRGVLYCCEI